MSLSIAGVSLLLKLILSHLIADFLIQTKSQVNNRFKKTWRSGWLYIHGSIAGLLAYVFSGYYNVFWILPVFFISHVVIDGLKSTKSDTLKWFTLDQLAHLLVILGVWYYLINPVIEIDNLASVFQLDTNLLIILIAYILVIWPSGIIVGKITANWQEEIEDSEKGLEKAGMWIGRLERFLLLTFVLLQQYQAIGLLVTAKSIFRFTYRREMSEYILIGTLLSFSIAILVGLLTIWFTNGTF